jgi:hypothetical protein
MNEAQHGCGLWQRGAAVGVGCGRAVQQHGDGVTA